jgi:acyl-CoA thioester hydrolase
MTQPYRRWRTNATAEAASARCWSTVRGVSEPEPFSVRVPLRVRFGETDAMGVANNGVYLSWLEIGRIEYLRALGHAYRDVHDGGLDLVVTEAHVSYLAPLRFDDAFAVVCWCDELRRASVRFAYELRGEGALHARATTRHACVDRASLRPVRLPEWLVAAVDGARL